jgi:transposase
MYIDYAGKRLRIIDKRTGELKEVELFVSILGASQLIFCEASYSQKKEDLVSSCENALHYYGGVPKAIVSKVP